MEEREDVTESTRQGDGRESKSDGGGMGLRKGDKARQEVREKKGREREGSKKENRTERYNEEQREGGEKWEGNIVVGV